MQKEANEVVLSFNKKEMLFLIGIAFIASAFVVVIRTRKFYFFSDDFLNFIIAVDMGLTWKYLFRDVFGQFIPLYRLSNSLYLHVCGLHFWPFRLFLVLFNGCSICLISCIAWKRNVSLVVLLPTLALLLFSPVFVTTYQWWSAALSVLTSAIASMACVSLIVQGETLSFPRKLALAASFLIGLLFYPKGLFIIIPLFTTRLFFRVSEGQVGITRPVLLDVLREMWPTLILAAVYLAIVHFGRYRSEVIRPDLATLIRFVWEGWNSGFLTVTLGLHYGIIGVTAANIVFFAFIVWSIFLDRSNLILWTGFMLYFILSIGVIGWNRAVPFGLESAEIGRYYADIMCVFLATAVIAFGRSPKASIKVISLPSLVVVVVITALGSIHLLSAGERVPHLWYAGPERPALFVANVRHALHAVASSETIADGDVPGYIMPSWMSPLNRYKLFVRLLGWHGKIINVQDAARAFDQNGELILLKHGI